MEEYGVPEEKVPYFSKYLISDEEMEFYGITDRNIFKKYSNTMMENDKGEMVADSTARLKMRCGDDSFDAYLVDIKGFTPAYGTDRCVALESREIAERLEELPPPKPIPMHLLSTDELINILQGEPARDWWEGMMWKFGGGIPDEEDVRRILAAYGATAGEIEKLLALIGSTFEGRSIENVDQLVALVQNLSREGLYIADILSRFPSPPVSLVGKTPGHPLLAAVHKEFEETLLRGKRLE